MTRPRSDELAQLLTDAAGRGARYLRELGARPVFPAPESVERLRAALDEPLPERGIEDGAVLSFLDEVGSPATVASAGGRYFGFVTGGALPAAVAAHTLATAWDQNSFSFVSSPAIALFEEAALRWLREALRLPAEVEGAFVTGATMASFTAMAAARHRVLKNAGWDVETDGLLGAPGIQVIVGEEVHASVLKVLALLGMGRGRVTRVPVDGEGRMRADSLPTIEPPAILCVQAGNVNSGGFDPAEIIVRSRDAGAWVHVDGAFGLWARASPSLAPIAAGYAQADSWTVDAHKWLNVPYDCGIAFVRDVEALRAAMSISGDYLLLGARRAAIDVTPDSSRRARALDVWAALRALGRSGLAEMIERHCEQARWLADRLRAAGVEILNDVVLNQVVVRFGTDERTERALTALQASGECWCGGTTWRGRSAMRISVSSWATSQADLDRTLAAILAARA